MPADKGPLIEAPAHDLTGHIQIEIPKSGHGRPFPPVDHGLKTVTGPVQQPKAAAPEAGTVGFHHRQHRTDRHCRVEGIAARREDLMSRLGGQGMGSRDRRLVGSCRH